MEQIQVISEKETVHKFEIVQKRLNTSTTKYEYKLMPYHPVNKIMFIYASESNIILDTHRYIMFKNSIVLNIDNSIHKPSVLDLLALANACIAKSNLSLRSFISSHEISLVPFDPLSTQLYLERGILSAFPDN